MTLSYKCLIEYYKFWEEKRLRHVFETRKSMEDKGLQHYYGTDVKYKKIEKELKDLKNKYQKLKSFNEGGKV